MSYIISKFPQISNYFTTINTQNYTYFDITEIWNSNFEKIYGSTKTRKNFVSKALISVPANSPLTIDKQKVNEKSKQTIAISVLEYVLNSKQEIFKSGGEFNLPYHYERQNFKNANDVQIDANVQSSKLPPLGNISPKLDGLDDLDGRSKKQSKKLAKEWKIGFDTEYVARGNQNEVISTQLWIFELGIGLVLVHEKDRRTELSTLSSLLLALLGHFASQKTKLVYVAHWNLAEFSSLSQRGRDEIIKWNPDIKEFSRTKRGSVVRKSVVVKNGLKLKIHTARRAKKQMCIKVSCEFRDTFLINQTSLKDIGETLGLPKLDINDDIEQMDVLFNQDFAKFLDYSLRDAHIVAVYYNEFVDFCINEHISKIPITSSEFGELFLRARLSHDDFLAAICGEETIVIENEQKRFKIGYSEFFASYKYVYRGGRNECYCFDEDDNLPTYDYDLKNAYPTSMMTFGRYFYDVTPKKYVGINSVMPDDLGWADVEFECEDWVNFPPFSYDDVDDKGLIHFRKGRLRVTTIELWTAWTNGFLKKCVIKDSLYYRSVARSPLEGVVSDLIHERTKFKEAGDKVRADNLKITTNSIYGKFAQGLKKKDMPPSLITNPAVASFITGTIRAAVCEQMNWIYKKYGDVVLSVTTDGYFLKVKLTDEDLENLKNLPCSKRLSDARSRNGHGEDILELKHEGEGFYCWRTRLYGELKGEKTLIAKGGVKLPKNLSNAEIKERLKETSLKGCYTEVGLVPKSEVIKKGKDLVAYEKKDKKILLDLDYKRKHVGFSVSLDRSHVVIKTAPYDDLADFERHKKAYEKVYGRSEPIFAHRNVHHSIERFEQFYLFYNIYLEIDDDYRLMSLEMILKQIEAVKLLEQGLSYSQVALKVGVAKSTIGNWANSTKFSYKKLSTGLRNLLESQKEKV